MTIGIGWMHVPLRLFNTSSRMKEEIDVSGEESRSMPVESLLIRPAILVTPAKL